MPRCHVVRALGPVTTRDIIAASVSVPDENTLITICVTSTNTAYASAAVSMNDSLNTALVMSIMFITVVNNEHSKSIFPKIKSHTSLL